MLQPIARLILKLCGWTAVTSVPSLSKAVIIAGPHTSNWDAFWAIVYLVATRQRVKFYGKHTLFWFPLGQVLGAFGCIPLDRTQATSVVDQAIHQFNTLDQFVLGLSPEGTRSRADGWKSGFYRIARGAKVPVLVGVIDYRRKTVGLVARVDLSDDLDADMRKFQQLYEGVEGRKPELVSPIRLR